MGLITARTTLISPPETHQKLSAFGEQALRDCHIHGKIPTDLNVLYNHTNLKLVDNHEATSDVKVLLRKLKLPKSLHRKATLGLNKVRGAVNLRTRKVWIPSHRHAIYERFPTAHEWAHGRIPWHEIAYLDDHETLQPEVREIFEQEANFLGAEILFQGKMFRERVLGAKESLESALQFAVEHETTYASTLWKYVQVLDRPVALAVYKKARIMCQDGAQAYQLRRLVPSRPFVRYYGNIEIPNMIFEGSPWLEAIGGVDKIARGTDKITCQHMVVDASWESWSNTYDLYVFIRIEPGLRFAGQVIRSTAQRLSGIIRAPSTR